MNDAGGRGFTLLELFIAIAILGILAAVLIPMLGTNSDDAKQASLGANLAILNKAVERYALDHDHTYPGTIGGSTTWANFVTHLTTQTDKAGDPGTDYGPYLRTGIPVNPVNGLKNGAILKKHLLIPGTVGWFYIAETGEVLADTTGRITTLPEAVGPVPILP